MRKTFLYQINVTRDCNLRCTHCYISSDVKKASGKMEGNSFLKIVDGIAEHMQKIGYEHAEIHVIGGEPTMLGLPFFEENLPEARRRLEGHHFSFELIMVSNLLNKDIVDISRHFDRINTSWEPITRFPKKKLEEFWQNNVTTLQDAGIDVGITTAVTKQVIEMGADAILEHHYSKGIKQIHFGFFIPSGDGLTNINDIFPPFIETSRFMMQVADWYFARRDADPDLWVNPPESMLAAIESGEPLDDIVCPIIAGSMDIDWDGKTATCLEAGGETDAQWLGNVLKTSISDVASSPEFRKEVRKAMRPNEHCMTCDEYIVCKSGCGVNFKFWDPEKDEDCPGFKAFIKDMRSRHQGGLRPRYTEYRGKVAF
ncbi:radical SAM protein [Thalassospira xianhensis]|uniref:radical SAM protein n=1 Tax=Thalassospira xianhensis TaxID=478503 RepID=UPI000DEDF2A9|nr:radical SAM protein [Thalassospira xianhensis]